MIKIVLDKRIKAEIEKIYLKDAKSSGTAIFKVLDNPQNKSYLNTHFYSLYCQLYNKKGNPDEDQIKKLLFASKEELKEYINILGDYSTKQTEANWLLNNIFKYENFSKRKIVKDILQKMNVTVCPYCNRQYVFTVPKKGGPRPQLDHYFPKSRYPYLALSLWNFVPSCSNCNMAKSSLDTLKEPILYPYEEEFGYDIQFVVSVADKKNDYIKVVQGVSDQFELELKKTENVSQEMSDKADRQMKQLYLDELYKLHSDYVMDILKSKYVRSPALIRGLCNQFPKLFSSYQEVENLLYMSDIRKENWGKRPLSKLTHDLHQNTIR